MGQPKVTSSKLGTKSKKTSGDLVFRPSARLQRFLGRELISDPNLAVIEFVKNAYDAGASNVFVDFQLENALQHLVITDDGIGMNLQSFRDNWMRPGFSAKSKDSPAAPRGRAARSTDSKQRSDHRIPIGEKGIGRLAAGRLGKSMDIYTRQASNQPWLHVEIDWDAFDDMTKFMDEIIVKHNYLDKIPGESHEIKVGTSIVISRLQLNWLGRIPGPKRSGRSEYRLGRLSEDLTILVRPLDIGPGDFAITLDSDLVPDDSVKLGTITPEAAIREAPYHYQFEVFLDKKNGATVNRTLRRSAAFAKDFGKKRVENLKPASIEWIIDQTGSSEKHSVDSASPLPCGPFKGSFLYLPPRARQRASSEEVVGHGVLLYRDGVLVEPYGLRGNDWIGAEARKAQRQGHAPIQPDTFWGEVEISRDSNPLLRDTANRQGLLDNDASAIFLAIIREEFSTFESEILDEIESRWLSREERAAEVAEQQITAVVLRTRTFAHHLRQPLVGIAGELTSLKRLAKSFEMTDAQKSRFNDIVKRLEDYFQRSENLVNEYAKSRVPEFRDVSTDEILALVKSACVEIAVDHSASLVFENGKRMEVVVPIELVADALIQLVTNAIEADRPTGRLPIVSVRCHVEKRMLVIDISDNGTGMKNVKAGTDLADVSLASTKGHPAEGLVLVATTLAYSRGRATVTGTSKMGTQIRVEFGLRLK